MSYKSGKSLKAVTIICMKALIMRRNHKTALGVQPSICAGVSLFFLFYLVRARRISRSVLQLDVWCSLGALMTLNIQKSDFFYPPKIVGSQITRKLMHISRITKKWKTGFPRTEKYGFTNHGKNKSSFTLHAKQKCPFTRHGKSIGDPRNM